MVLSQAEKYENRLKKQIEEYEIKDKAQRKQNRLLNDRNNLMNERERKQDERELRNILVQNKTITYLCFRLAAPVLPRLAIFLIF